MKKTAIYGAAFNPPHCGHIDVISQVIDRFDTLVLVPSAAHAFGKIMAPFKTRCSMLSLILREYFPDNEKLVISQIEQELLDRTPDKPVYTWDVLQTFSNQSSGNESISFIIGPDNAKPENWQRFYNHSEIENHYELLTAEQRIPVRSTMIRELLASSQSDNEIRDLIYEYTGNMAGKFLIDNRELLYRP